MRSTSAGVWRIQRDASTSDASISVIGWRTSWIVEARNSSRTVSIRSVSADRASIVAPSMASLTSAIAPTMSPTGRSSSRKRWSARAISWRSNRNSVAIATGPSRCSNRIWAWARAFASIASSSIGASPASPGARRARQQVDDGVEQGGDVVRHRPVRVLPMERLPARGLEPGLEDRLALRAEGVGDGGQVGGRGDLLDAALDVGRGLIGRACDGPGDRLIGAQVGPRGRWAEVPGHSSRATPALPASRPFATLPQPAGARLRAGRPPARRAMDAWSTGGPRPTRHACARSATSCAASARGRPGATPTRNGSRRAGRPRSAAGDWSTRSSASSSPSADDVRR